MNQPAKLALAPGIGLPVFYLFWIIFVGSFSPHELLIGIIATVLASAGLLVIILQYPARFSPSFAELLSFWSLAWYLFSGTWEIVLVAAQDLLHIKSAQSLFRTVSFDAGRKDDPHATARRALAVVYTTVAPNFIVLGINTSDRQLLFHQIRRSPVPTMTKQLGAQP